MAAKSWHGKIYVVDQEFFLDERPLTSIPGLSSYMTASLAIDRQAADLRIKACFTVLADLVGMCKDLVLDVKVGTIIIDSKGIRCIAQESKLREIHLKCDSHPTPNVTFEPTLNKIHFTSTLKSLSGLSKPHATALKVLATRIN